MTRPMTRPVGERPICQGCRTARRAPHHYLCGPCWTQLPAAARKALCRRGPQAALRLIELHRQLNAGVPLAKVVITQ